MKKIAVLALSFITGSFLYGQDVILATSGTQITVQNGTALTTSGGITLNNGSIVSNDGAITISKTALGTANFTDNTITPYSYGSGKFIFTGSGNQNIISPNLFSRIDIEDAVTLGSNIRSDKWHLTSGKITTGSFYAIATTAAVNAVEADAANTNFSTSWINGNLRRFITPSSVNNYIFPVGDAAKVNIAEMDNLTATPLTGINYINASFGVKPGSDAGLNVNELGVPYTSVNNGGVWYLTSDATPVSGRYDLKLFFNGFSGLTDNTFGSLLRPEVSSNAADWQIPSGSALPAINTAGRTVASAYAKRNNIAGFGQWGIAMTVGALPLQLLSFNAAKSGKTVLLDWTTTNEINTSHFELYKVLSPASLDLLGKISAAGTSTAANHYSYIDQQPLTGNNFYQLKMVDVNNNFRWSQVVKVTFNEAGSFKVYPNPVINKELFVACSAAKIKSVQLYAADGKLIPSTFIKYSNDLIKIQLSSFVAKGTYTVLVKTDMDSRSTLITVD